MTYISGALSKDRKYVHVWERENNKVTTKKYPAPYYFYMKNANGEYKDIHGTPLTKIEFDNSYEFYDAKRSYKDRGIDLYESDINPVYKVLSQHYYNKPVNKLNFTLFDIETDYDPNVGFSSPENPYAPINAISLYHHHTDEMKLLVVLPDNGKWTAQDIPKDLYEISDIVVCKTEKELLLRFLDEIHNSDIISGWNSSGFDVPYLYTRMLAKYGEAMANRLSFPNAPAPKVKQKEVYGELSLRISIYGRCHIDYMDMTKKFQQTDRPSWSLDAVSNDELPDLPKLEYEGSLHNLYYNNFPHFCRYNVRDTEVLKGLEHKFGYMETAIHQYHSSTAMLEDVLGTVKIVESAIINKCHYDLNAKVHDGKKSGFDGDSDDNEKYTGALVLDPITGMHKWVFAIDVNSLYPSAIRTLNISPETIIGQFYNDHIAFEEIQNNTNKNLTLLFENGENETHTAAEWRHILKSRKWSISGYGTIFDQNFTGFIPELLTEWYSNRKKFKKLKESFKDKMISIGNKNSQEYKDAKEKYEYYDRQQFIMKLLLNSTYGCLGNEYFKFFDIRMAESTTRSGQSSLMHMVKTVAYHLDGKYEYPSPSCIYSDTDSCYAKAPCDNFEDTLKLAKIIEKKVNKSFVEFTRNAFFCNDGYDNLIMAELDVIADNSIFVKKKYYIMHLLYSDGKREEKMKVMGLQIKKTTIPAPIKKTLTKYLEEFLKGEEWSVIAKKVVDYKDELLTQEILSIGLPQGIKNYEKYMNAFKNNEKCTIPGHVMASIMYNQCLETYNDKESPKIKTGSKIRKFIFKKPYGRFNSIAIPTDLKKPPSWFMEHFMNNIDKDAQILRLVDKPLETILNAIDKHPPTKKTILVDELFEF